MDQTTTDPLTAAREKTRLAARWLNLLAFKPAPGGPSVSPSMSHYHDMLDPETTDARRLGACQALSRPVLRAIDQERMKGEEAYANARPPDPYKAIWQTTERGAALEFIGALIAHAIETFEAEGVEV